LILLLPLLRKQQRKTIPKIVAPRIASPPTTPPAMTPALIFDVTGCAVGVIVLDDDDWPLETAIDKPPPPPLWEPTFGNTELEVPAYTGDQVCTDTWPTYVDGKGVYEVPVVESHENQAIGIDIPGTEKETQYGAAAAVLLRSV
jgi:hypothetical protein